MTTSRWSSRVCDDPSSPPRSSRRTAASLATAAGLALLLAAAPAGAANNPGTGDSGFFTFRPSPAVGGTQINVASGNALIRTRDLASSAANYNVVVDRAYNSLAPDTFSILSPRWAFDVGPTNRLTVESNQDVTAAGPSGYKIRFARQSNGSYIPPSGFDGSLTKTSSGWTLTRTSQGDQFGYGSNGKLAWTKDAAARDFTAQGTSAAGRDVLSSYGTSSGRRVNLSYTGDSLVREMDDPSSGHHYYRYTNGRLTQYEAPGGATTGYRYNSAGRLDKITEPGGTTVELDTTAGGRVSSITHTLPGGVPQTTSFVYTRRPYKTDVTGPDGVRRTYAYDDDWRITRQYNPDVKPTVTASGELRDLADDYVGPNRTYPLNVAAEGPDGAGLRRLSVERESGNEIAGADVPCTATPFDLVCPTTHSSTVDSSFADVPEGRQTIRGAAEDDESNRGQTTAWDVLVDKSAPPAPTNTRLEYWSPEDASGVAVVGWDTADDPQLADGEAGSGVTRSQVRYRSNAAPFSAWADAEDHSLEVSGRSSGDTLEVETRSIDAVGNVSSTSLQTIEVAEQLEDPAVREAAAEAYQAEYGGSLAQAEAWMAVQEKADSNRGSIEIGVRVSDAAPGHYGGIWYDNATREVVADVTSGASHQGVEAALAAHGVGAASRVRTVTYTQSQLEQAQPDLESQLSDLLYANLVSMGRDTIGNSIDIEIAASATAAQRARVDAAADASPVRVVVTESADELIEGENTACKWPYCDKPARGGVKIVANPGGGGCTAGFIARRNSDNKRVALTAGHCFNDSQTLWSTADRAGNRLFYGTALRRTYGEDGDTGILELSPTLAADAQNWVFVIDSDTDAGPFTTRNPHYRIRGSATSKVGNYVCFSGYASGSRCGKIRKVNQTFKDKDDNVLIKHVADAAVCSTSGDSGGPVYKGGLAFGTVVGRRRNRLHQCVGMAYMGAKRAELLNGVTISG